MAQYLRQYLSDLEEFLRIPSISTEPEHAPDMERAVSWVEQMLQRAGFEVCERHQVSERSSAPPILFGQRQATPDSGKPTLLIYGHYDVQPPDPVEAWQSPPFEPTVRNGNLYARGATDDKGQLFTHLAALIEMEKQFGDNWPVSVKVLIEGEEEVGGESLHLWLQESGVAKKIAADVCLISDSEFHSPGQPAIEYGVRGIAYFQMDVRLADQDLHSGLYGGGVLNPANALVSILSQLYSLEAAKVLIPGFYDSVAELTQSERESLAQIPFSAPHWLRQAQNATAEFGEPGYTTLERISTRPTFDIHGLWSGFSGEGEKTIIPATAHAKFSCRLVAKQKPEELVQLVLNYVRQIAPPEVEVNVRCLSAAAGALSPLDSVWMQAAAESLKAIFGRAPLFTRSGGSLPIVADLQTWAGIDSLLVGYGLPDDNLHAPNEKISLEHVEKAIACNLDMYQSFGRKQRT